jgi:hypothetical protein
MYGSTRILTAGGAYVDLASLTPGAVIAGVRVSKRVPRRIVPVQIDEIRSRPPTIGESIVAIRHDGFYDMTMCASTDVDVLVRDQVMKQTSWINVGEMDETPFAGQDIVTVNTFVLPPNFDEPPPAERRALLSALTYELGYVFGSFLRIGCLRSFPETRFVFDARSSNAVAELQRCAVEVFKSAPIVTRRGHLVQLSFMSRYMYNIFTSFGTLDKRQIPDTFRKAVPEFAKGVNVGIVTSGHAGLPRLPQTVHETLYFGALASGAPLCYGQMEFDDGSDNRQTRACFGQMLVCEKAQNRDIEEVASRLYSLKFSTSCEDTKDIDGDESMIAVVANNLIVDIRSGSKASTQPPRLATAAW